MNKYGLSDETFEKIRLANSLKLALVSIFSTIFFGGLSYLMHYAAKTHMIYAAFVMAYALNTTFLIIYLIVCRKLIFLFARYFYFLLILVIDIITWGIFLFFTSSASLVLDQSIISTYLFLVIVYSIAKIIHLFSIYNKAWNANRFYNENKACNLSEQIRFLSVDYKCDTDNFENHNKIINFIGNSLFIKWGTLIFIFSFVLIKFGKSNIIFLNPLGYFFLLAGFVIYVVCLNYFANCLYWFYRTVSLEKRIGAKLRNR